MILWFPEFSNFKKYFFCTYISLIFSLNASSFPPILFVFLPLFYCIDCLLSNLVLPFTIVWFDLLWKLVLLSQILWTFSIYLEAVAILPQLVLLQRSRNIDNLTGNYAFLLGYAIYVYKMLTFFWSYYPFILISIAYTYFFF